MTRNPGPAGLWNRSAAARAFIRAHINAIAPSSEPGGARRTRVPDRIAGTRDRRRWPSCRAPRANGDHGPPLRNLIRTVPAGQCGAQRAAIEDPESAGRTDLPFLVAGERLGRHDGDAIPGGRHGAEVDLHLGVAQRGATERRLADDVAEL